MPRLSFGIVEPFIQSLNLRWEGDFSCSHASRPYVGSAGVFIRRIATGFGYTKSTTTRTVVPESAVFLALAERWNKERGATSSMTKMVMCPSYQRIIGMGERAVPLILRRL